MTRLGHEEAVETRVASDEGQPRDIPRAERRCVEVDLHDLRSYRNPTFSWGLACSTARFCVVSGCTYVRDSPSLPEGLRWTPS